MLKEIAALVVGGQAITDEYLNDMDVSARCETLLNQSVYLGLWCWSNTDRKVYSVEANLVRVLGSLEPTSCWLEDGHINRVMSDDQVQVFYDTIDEALAVYHKIIVTLIDREKV